MRRVFKTRHFARWMGNPVSFRRIAMATRPRARSPISAAVHEGARDLYDTGFLTERRMREYDLMCLETLPPTYSGEQIRALRARHKLTRARLASLLNTRLLVVRLWEEDALSPSGPAFKLLNLLDRKGVEALT